MTQFDAIFAALEATGVRYVVVGGVAVNLRGYQRFTKDIDLVIELVPEQTLKALEALTAIGYQPNIPVKIADFANPAIREGWVREKGMTVFQMYSDQTRMSIGILAEYPIDFDALWKQATQIKVSGNEPRIASDNHLLQMKEKPAPPSRTFEDAELFHLRMALKSTYEQRLQDLQDMIDFNARVEASNPGLREIAEKLR